MSLARADCLFFLPITCLLLFLLPSPVLLADPSLELSIDEVSALAGDQSFGLPVHLTNVTDTIAGIEFWFQLDRPGAAFFVPKIDTVGTLLAGWDYLDVRLMGGSDLGVKVTAAADLTPPITNRGFGPQSGDTPLLKLQVSIPEQPDPITEFALIHIITEVEQFGFATPQGGALCVECEEEIVTTFFRCTEWHPDPDSGCVNWIEVTQPPIDSAHTDTTYSCWVDTACVRIDGGRVTIIDPVCGNIDGSLDGLVTMGDLTLLIDHLFISLEPLRWPSIGNVDGSSDDLVTMGDLTKLIDHLFISLDDLDCVE